MALNAVIPLPNVIGPTAGPSFTVHPGEQIAFTGEAADSPVASYVLSAFSIPGQAPAVAQHGTPSGRGQRVTFAIATPVASETLDVEPSPQDETYRIEIDKDRVLVEAASQAGMARAVATLLQIADRPAAGRLDLPSCIIEDSPRYGWRGLSLDVARSFYPADEIKRIIDLLALYKLNTLHLHLSDDQGWRIETPSRPLLTEISGKTAVSGGRTGHLTVEDFKGIVAHAASRGVTVVPEIDSPGHTFAATHAYGELMPDGLPTPVNESPKVGLSRLYAACPTTGPFLTDVLTDLCALTPGRFVHIGGDEAKELGDEEYETLVAQAIAPVAKAGKQVVAWQEAAGTALPDGSVLQYWAPRPELSTLVSAAQSGKGILMSPAPHTYFDMKYDDSTPLGHWWAGLVDLPDAYNWDPAALIEGIGEEHIVGVEAAIWTEFIHSFDELTYMLLPRLPALSEVGWTSQDSRDWDRFRERISAHPTHWDNSGLSWHHSEGVAWEQAS